MLNQYAGGALSLQNSVLPLLSKLIKHLGNTLARTLMLEMKKFFELNRKCNGKHHRETTTSRPKEIREEEQIDKILHSNSNKGKEKSN